MSSRTKLSIVCAASRDTRVVDQLTASLVANVPADLFEAVELLVVGDREYAGGLTHPVVTVRSLVLAGAHPNAKRNAGLMAASYPTVALLDDDVKVTDSWFRTVHEVYTLEGFRGLLTGPSDLPYDASFSQTMASALSNNPLHSLRGGRITRIRKPVGHLDAEFCNTILTRCVWEQLDRFDEDVDFRLDDTLFCFRAVQAGIPIVNHPGLVVAHRRRDFPMDFFRHQASLKFHAGKNIAHFPSLFAQDPGAWLALVLLLVPVAPLGLWLLWWNWKIVAGLAGLYFAGCYLMMVRYAQGFLSWLLTPPFLLVFHGLSLLCLWVGAAYGLLTRRAVACMRAAAWRKIGTAQQRGASGRPENGACA